MTAEFNAIVLAGGAGLPRDLPVPGRELKGIHFAMEYLTLSNKRVEGDRIADADFISAKGKRVVIIGGGDTGADCLGTVHRQGALSVHQFELLPKPPDTRAADNPVAAVAEHLPRVDRARRGWRARVLRVDAAIQRRRAGTRQEAPWLEGRARAQGRQDVVRERARQRVRDGRRSRAAGDGFSRPGAAGAARQFRRQADRARQRVARRELDDQRARQCSRQATCSAASR